MTALAQAEMAATDAAASTSTATTVGGDASRVDTPHRGYERMLRRSRKMRAIYQGTDAVRELMEHDKTILPQLEGESEDGYAIRKQLASVHPGFETAVDVSVGLLLAQEPTLDEDMSPELVNFWEDVTGSQVHGAVFCQELVQHAVVDGIAGIFTDYTRQDDPTLDRSQASAAAADPDAELDESDTKALGLRPYWVLVKADEILKPVYKTIRGMKTLVLFIRKEVAEEQVGRFGTRMLTRYRAYSRVGKVVTCTLFEKPEGANEPAQVGKPVTLKGQTEIPWSPLRAGKKLSDVEVLPALQATGDLVVQYLQTETNELSLQTLACTTTLVRIGAKTGKDGKYPPITIGPKGCIEAPYLEGIQQPVYSLVHDVSVLAPLAATLTRIETKMGVASGSFLSPDKKGVETAKAKEIGERGTNAKISKLARALQDCLELAFIHVANFLGIRKKGSITVSRAFEVALMEPNVMLAYGKLIELGMPVRLAVAALKLQGRLPADANEADVVREWEVGLAAAKAQKEMDDELARQAGDPQTEEELAA